VALKVGAHKILNKKNMKNNELVIGITKLTSQVYRLHEFVSNPCEIYYFMGSYHLHTNVMHYLNTKFVCMTFMCKQYE
jgi:hypothetical protein